MAEQLDIAAIEAALSEGDRRRIPGNNFASPDKIEEIIRQLIAAHKAKDAEIAELEAELVATDDENERLKHRLARLQDATRGENNETR